MRTVRRSLELALAFALGLALGFAFYDLLALLQEDAASFGEAVAARRFVAEFNDQHVYLTFSVDLDRAVDDSFGAGVDTLLAFYESIGALRGVTWYANEQGYGLVRSYPEVLTKILKSGGELGLHTHINSDALGGGTYFCSRDPARFVRAGLVEPKARLEDFASRTLGEPYKILSFKGGNHCRNRMMYEALIEGGFLYDTTMVFEGVRREEVDGAFVALYDDLDLHYGRGPWYLLPEHPYRHDPRRRLLEIPEASFLGKKKMYLHVRALRRISPTTPAFFIFQVHPYQMNTEQERAVYFQRVRDAMGTFKSRRFVSVRDAGALYKKWLAANDESEETSR